MKVKKQLLSFVLTLAMVITMLPVFSVAAFADATRPAWAVSGSGTAADPYIITSTGGLEALATALNGGTYTKWSDFIKLSDDFDNSEPLTTPIGKIGNTFHGNFDGNNQTVVLDIDFDSSHEDGVGLFGAFTPISSNIIKNVNTKGTISAINNGDHLYVGGIVGRIDYNNGHIVNCNSEVQINAVDKANWIRVGGIVGESYSNHSIANCSFSGSISGSA